MPSPFPCSPVTRECSRNKTQIETPPGNQHLLYPMNDILIKNLNLRTLN